MPRDTEEHPLKIEGRGLLRWMRRRWWVVYFVVLVQSAAWVSAIEGQRHRGLLVHGELPPPDGPAHAWRFSETRERVRSEGAEVDFLKTSYIIWPERTGYADAVHRRETFLDTASKISLRIPNGKEVVVLLHGSPGEAEDFDALARAISNSDRRIIALDLPGFGHSDRWPSGYSIRDHARSVIALLNDLSLPRFHLVGWSMGGGVALDAIDLLGEKARDRVASLTLMASIGVQEGEGSGSYAFEHFKYGVGFVGLVAAPELIPHFGLLGDRRDRYSFLRNFWDTDQRSLRGIMERVRVPTLVLHGRRDVLVPSWVAEESHRLISSSRLVMLDANHFLPLMQAEESARILEEHFARHDVPGVEARTDTVDVAPVEPARTLITKMLAGTGPVLRSAPWWVEIGAIAGLAVVFPVLTCVGAGLLCAHQQLDLFEAITGVVIGWVLHGAAVWVLVRCFGERVYSLPLAGTRLARVSRIDWLFRLAAHPVRSGWWDHFAPARRQRAIVGSALLHRLPLAFVVARLAAIAVGAAVAMLVPFVLFTLCVPGVRTPPLIGSGAWTEFAVVAGVIVVTWVVMHAMSRSGRSFMRARLARMVRHEFWPAWLFYVPLYVYLVPLSIRWRGLMTPSCCNPGIENGGGLVGESKDAIMRALLAGATERGRGAVLGTHLIEAGEDARKRGERVEELMARHGMAFPVILKPDEGQRGFAVRLIRNGDEARRYFEGVKRDVVLQSYHAGPCECGILWARVEARSGREEVERVEAGGTPAPLDWVEEKDEEERKQRFEISDLKFQSKNKAEANKADMKKAGMTKADMKTPGMSARAGFIFSITRKEFPVIVGDGKRTLEELIDAHARFRCQAGVYLERFADDASRVLGNGESMRLAVSGNHCQGTLFRDGADLITPELERAIDELAAGFPGRDGSPGGLDFGRFDVRYASDEELRAGRGFGIVELNGTMSESTNLYDPSRSLWWSYSVLFRQWGLLFRLGAERRGTGERGMTVREFVVAVREHFGERDGSAVAD